MVIYVDDGIIASNQQSFIDNFLVALGAEFLIRFHPIERVVGISIETGRRKGFTFRNLTTPLRYLKNFGWLDVSPRRFRLTQALV